MPAKYIVTLTPEQREHLQRTVRAHKSSARQRTRARILLAADTSQATGAAPESVICHKARTSLSTVVRVKRRFVEGGLEAALTHKAQANRKAKALDGRAEAHLIALVCGTPPDGYKRWSLHLLKDALIEAHLTDTVSHETIRQTLKKTNSSRG